MRSIGCSIVAGLFVIFNMFYLQAKLADTTLPARERRNSGILTHTEAALVLVKKAKMNQARRMMVWILAGVLLSMTLSRFLYGISSNFARPTCFILLFTGRPTSFQISLTMKPGCIIDI